MDEKQYKDKLKMNPCGSIWAQVRLNGFEMDPYWAQMSLNGFEVNPNGFEWARTGTKIVQMGPDWPKMRRNGSKIGPNGCKIDLKCDRGTLRGSCPEHDFINR